MKIVIAGPKSVGKSTISRIVAEYLEISFVETDNLIEDICQRESGKRLTCREICRLIGEPGFRALEQRAVEEAAAMDWCIVCAGGSTLLNADSRRLLRKNALLVLLQASPDELWTRLQAGGIPAYLESHPDPRKAYLERSRLNEEVIQPFADVIIDTTGRSPEEIAGRIIDGIQNELASRMPSPSTFGEIIRISTFGESHGPAVGAILDGVPPGLPLSPDDIQKELNRRRPGQSAVTTPRSEPDQVRILSGVFEGKTTGAPVGMIVENRDQDSSRYDNLRDVFRPGHADFTFWKKFGIRDHRGGGRSSGRETTARVMGGAIARKILDERGVKIIAYALEIAGIRAQTISYDEIERNPVRCPDPKAAVKMEEAVLAARSEKDSVGGIVQLEISGIPAGLGDPVFGKLDARLGAAILSLGAVKGIEFGLGFQAARMRGSQNNDPMRDGRFVSNNAGGILGGISTGQDIIARLAVKPTSSIEKEQQTCNIRGENVNLVVEGRHDPCIVPRVIPVVESMAALVILDLLEMQAKLRTDWDHSR